MSFGISTSMDASASFPAFGLRFMDRLLLWGGVFYSVFDEKTPRRYYNYFRRVRAKRRKPFSGAMGHHDYGPERVLSGLDGSGRKRRGTFRTRSATRGQRASGRGREGGWIPFAGDGFGGERALP